MARSPSSTIRTMEESPPVFEGILGDPPESPDRPVGAEEAPPSLGSLLPPTPTPTDQEAIAQGQERHRPRGILTLSDGALYLPARRRVQWMRGDDIVAHPEWGIQTEMRTYDIGTYKGTKTVGRRKVPDITGGYAVFVAHIVEYLDGTPVDGLAPYRIIASGTAIERSENFPDYIEKAETSAIARALAVAGYGTESALDFDEGLEDEQVADSPIRADGTLGGIFINGSRLAGVGVGGQQSQITEIQFNRIRELARVKELDPLAMKMAIENALGDSIDLTSDFPASGQPDEMRNFILAAIREMTSEEAGRLVVTLELSDDPTSP